MMAICISSSQGLRGFELQLIMIPPQEASGGGCGCFHPGRTCEGHPAAGSEASPGAKLGDSLRLMQGWDLSH